MTYLSFSDDMLNEKRAFWTAKEISQQPEMWLKTQKIIDEQETSIKAFLKPILALDNLRIILTGAGTSAYIGECLEPLLLQNTNKNIQAIATTDLVSGPHLYFQKNQPTLLVSFSRSGGSPESVAAINLSKQVVDDCYQLIFTCNQEGELYLNCREDKKSFAFLLPEETHDRSFAMTSSFTCMMYAAHKILSNYKGQVSKVSEEGTKLIKNYNGIIKDIAKKPYWRVIYLGSNSFKGLARESSLKLLELTDGQIITTYESSLGFRHGPKCIITAQTLIFMFISNDPYTRQYDLDLFNEIKKDKEVGRIIAISAQDEKNIAKEDHIKIEGMDQAEDADLLYIFILCAQMYGFHRALKLGNSPDSPSATGTVNRVVKGVTIHPYGAV